MEVKGFEVTGDERVGEGGHLRLRRMRMRLLLSDGSRTAEGSWDYVERPMGLDAVVVALFRRKERAVEVLLRHGIRVPLQFGRIETPPSLLLPELVAGILEPGDDLFQRAAAEAMEEAGLGVDRAPARRRALRRRLPDADRTGLRVDPADVLAAEDREVDVVLRV